ncbi:hypothetical protein [Burkholderia vietnamiensis]|uniref:hypothetical protein n=1 Tax=Burkholderia vietnamiensis TaxID=60552 RepID=UPI000758EA72|nr:hypothetical protein [Burkholderia vietnamiensis]KVE73278.1 hypothetical protein WI98_19335 [Burkholderia vietnamiensis]KVF02307.1 hypothetical protein WJ03_05655 [Burkholderia vietnamiensis]KVF63414.1 hypothetical protein WJ17_27095 [Burkholderia vietnamiensis]
MMFSVLNQAKFAAIDALKHHQPKPCDASGNNVFVVLELYPKVEAGLFVARQTGKHLQGTDISASTAKFLAVSKSDWLLLRAFSPLHRLPLRFIGTHAPNLT